MVLGIGWGLLAAGIHAVMYVFVLSSSINGLCHHVGYKNFDNTATNIRFLALLTGGEGLHNNHHGFPRSPKFSFQRSEFDPAWPVIKLLIALEARQAVQDDRRKRWPPGPPEIALPRRGQYAFSQRLDRRTTPVRDSNAAALDDVGR